MKCETILEKGSSRLNEDNLIVEGHLFGVFDGATSLDKTRFENGKTGGFLASFAARSVFKTNHFPLVELANGANQAIYSRMIRHGVDLTRKENLWSTSAAVIRIQGNTLEWVQTGDAYIILIFNDNTHQVLVEQEDHDYETLCLWPARGKNEPSGTDTRLVDQIRKKRAEMNLTYGVLNGESRAMDFLNHGRESLDQVKAVLLFTDGLSIPAEKPEKKKDFTPLVTLYHHLGLAGLKNRIRQMENRDPACRIYPRFKTHDDIAAIAIENVDEAVNRAWS
ncbi:MAG: protein phosphatase 2C domain-containing protein [Desulfobacteraceae bacterium]